MAQWTTEQRRFLIQHANDGPEWCAKAMEERFGVKRDPDAVRRYGTYIGVSWRRYYRCPECRRTVLKVNRVTGLCASCSAKRLKERTRARYYEAEENQRETEREAAPHVRENNMYKKRISRLKKGKQ